MHAIQMRSNMCGFCDAPPITAIAYRVRIEGRPVQGRFPACARCAALNQWLAVGAAVVAGFLMVCAAIAFTDLGFVEAASDFGEEALRVQSMAVGIFEAGVAVGLASALVLRTIRHIRFDRRVRRRLSLVSVSMQAIAGHVGRPA